MNFSKIGLQRNKIPPKKKDKDKVSQSQEFKTAIVPKQIKTWYDIVVEDEASSSKPTQIKKEIEPTKDIQKWVEMLSQSPEMVIALQNLSQSQPASAGKIFGTLSKTEKGSSSLAKKTFSKRHFQNGFKLFK